MLIQKNTKHMSLRGRRPSRMLRAGLLLLISMLALQGCIQPSSGGESTDTAGETGIIRRDCILGEKLRSPCLQIVRPQASNQCRRNASTALTHTGPRDSLNITRTPSAVTGAKRRILLYPMVEVSSPQSSGNHFPSERYSTSKSTTRWPKGIYS